MASHVLAILIEHEKFNSCEKYAREFLNWLIANSDIDNLRLSPNAYSFALLTMLKKNELARDFC